MVVPAQRQRRRDDQLPPARQVLEIAVGPDPFLQHEADVLRVIYDRVREPPVQFLRLRRLPRSEPAVNPDDHRPKLAGQSSGRLTLTAIGCLAVPGFPSPAAAGWAIAAVNGVRGPGSV
jgi:hypothetical protein